MPTKRPQLVKGEIYHIILRGIENRKVFLDDKDRWRFLYDLVEFNDETPVVHNYYKFKKIVKDLLCRDVIPTKAREEEKEKKSIVEILVVCLMPNHIHLLLRQLTFDGISLFIQKLGGYSTYFNKKYHRFGSLFQRPFKAVHIKTQEQLEIVICYIHTNPLELIEPKWKERGIKDPKRAMKFLENYLWSSLPDYLGKKNLGEIIDRDFIDKIFKTPAEHRQWIKARLFQKTKLAKMLDSLKEQKFILE